MLFIILAAIPILSITNLFLVLYIFFGERNKYENYSIWLPALCISFVTVLFPLFYGTRNTSFVNFFLMIVAFPSSYFTLKILKLTKINTVLAIVLSWVFFLSIGFFTQ
ncbi:hypothetical protein Xhom_00301 [Xenorhabdus hominickii]|uniref:Uncharacterized protein n=1 Tax=Xenorhabdus hominickii TaxID=351679 RepID=A0A2G0Q7V0_XENHO|nr:hypothetical protein Xhom_02034 [Xenorhabdus hominickii]PHM57335.1 hypothetical protein Xhom_00301 [Xenorhabdus hominickii]